MDTHLPSSSVVVKVHQCPGIFSLPFFGIHKGSGKFNAIVNVVTAATPVKMAFAVLGSAFLLGITGAGFQLPLATCPGDGKNNSSRGDGVYKSRFSTTWNKKSHFKYHWGSYFEWLSYIQPGLFCRAKDKLGWNHTNTHSLEPELVMA